MSVEILEMFQRLNAEGITVILVTHDPKVASYAHRVIHIEDGQIQRDETPSPSVGRGPTTPAKPDEIPRSAPPRARRWRRPSLFPRTLRTAFSALRRNKMRSALTTLGVVIGVSAVIAMMEIGQGSKTAMQKTIAAMGASTLLVQSGAAASGGVTFGSGSVLTLTPQDAEEIARQCPAVSDVAPLVRSRSQIIYGNRNWVPMYVYGTSPSYLKVRDWENLDEGEMFSERDVRNANKVCVIGQTLVHELFQGDSPIGRELRIKNISFRVIGVLSRKGANMMGFEQDDIVLAPWTTIKYRVSGSTLTNTNQSATATTTSTVNSLNNLYPGSTALYPVQSESQQVNRPQPVRFPNVDQILVRATTPDQIPLAIDQITELLRERHRLRAEENDDFNIRDMTEPIKTLSSTSQTMSNLLLAVALISLIVGGVGIMNIMLVSVTERTREIGLRMAVGARAHHILRQFLVEAVVLCLFGGATGILLGRVASLLVRSILRWPTEASLPAIIAAVAVSAIVGGVFGVYPAWKASRLDPIEALRYE